jgi:hypothetical protein
MGVTTKAVPAISGLSMTGALMLDSNEAMAQDDTAGNYLATREEANLSPAEQYLKSIEPEEEPEEEFNLMGSIESAVDTTQAVIGDVATGITEIPSQVTAGVVDAVNETLVLADDLTSGIDQFFSDLGVPTNVQIFDENGEFDLDLITREAAESKGSDRKLLHEMQQADSVTGGLVRGIAQFMSGFLVASKQLQGLKYGGKLTKVALAGAITDATVFDPQEDRLSDLLNDHTELQNPVTEYLEADPTDSNAEGRLKNAIEGLALGGISDVFIKAVKTVRASRIASNKVKEIENAKATAEKLSSSQALSKDVTAEPEFIPFDQKASNKADELNAKAAEFRQASGVATDEAAANINTANLKTTDDVIKLIDEVAKNDSVKINEARREVITLEETNKLADDLGMSVKDLLSRRRGQAFNAEQAVASRKILLASGENLFKLADVAKSGSDEDVALFMQAMTQHRAIQQQVSGLTAEAGRALGSFRIMAESSKQQEKAIKEALDGSGGAERIKDIAEKMGDMKNAHQLNKFIEGATKATKLDMVYEVWINALLSNPATHMVNILGNSISAGVIIGERKIASLIGQARGSADSVALGEAGAQFKGMVEGAKEGLRLAYQVMKTGDPTDPLQKIESAKYKSLTAENLNLTGTAGWFADKIGNGVRMPGRSLMAGDELFKTVGYRMELNAIAHRTGIQEGLEGEALAQRISDILASPPENLHIQAIDAGRYQTFTKGLDEAGQLAQKFREVVPFAKVIMPFIRTPVNIVKFIGERTLLASLSPKIQAEFKAGGARRDLALAKIATGTTLMAIGSDYAASGDITGKGPINWEQRQMLMASGWQPYSIKVGDTYYSYNRLDPIGAFLGLSADMTDIILHSDDEADALDVATASIASIGQNVTSKTYLRGVSEFFEMFNSVSQEAGDNNEPAKRWLSRLAGTVVPSFVAGVERAVSPELSATYGIFDSISSRIPGLSESLPPRRNVFGDPIVLQGGLGPDILSPIYTSTMKDDPVINEIINQSAKIGMPGKTINGVKLTPEQYDRFVVLSSGKDNKYTKNVNVKSKLAEIFRSNQYQRATDGADGSKAVIIKNIFNGYKNAAKAQMIEEFPELKTELENAADLKKLNLTGY